MIVNYALNGIRTTPTFDHILIEPYARCVTNYSNVWVSNDPATIAQYGTITISTNSIRINNTSNSGGIHVWFKMYAVSTDNNKTDIINFVAAGHTVSLAMSGSISSIGTGSRFKAAFFDSGASYVYTFDVVSQTFTCPAANTQNWTIIGYDNGTDVTRTGAFLYDMNANSGFRTDTTIALNSFTVDGANASFTLSSDWGDR